MAQAPVLRGRVEEPRSAGREEVGRGPERKEGAEAGGILEARGQEGHVGLGKMGPGYEFHIQS